MNGNSPAANRRGRDDGSGPRGRDARTDGGYILITLGLMIIPLMAFAALAVDVGSWYARTTEMQKAADAAALAGVVWAPDYNKARTVAAKTLTDNGFTATSAASQTNGTITITMLPGGQVNSFTVTITDAKAPMFFSKAFTNNAVSLTRSATAVYYLPVPMGSPLAYFGGMASKYGQTTTTTTHPVEDFPYPYPPYRNPDTYKVSGRNHLKCAIDPAYQAMLGGFQYIDDSGTRTNNRPSGGTLPPCVWTNTYTTTTTGPQPITYTSPEFWANIMGPESSANNGDVFSPKCYGGNDCVQSGGGGNPGYQTNNSYNRSLPATPKPTGYTYTITVPSTATTSDLQVQVFDAGLYPRADQQTETGDNIDANDFTTEYQMYRTDSTPLDATDNLPMTAGDCSGTAGNSTPNSGYWALASGDAPTFENNWATLCTIRDAAPGSIYYLRVRTTHSADSASWGSGSNRYALQVLGTGGALANVQLSAYGDMAIYNNTPAGNSQFYLARVGPEFAGKTLDVDLWDPGDAAGTATMTVIPPSGNATCTWSSELGQGYSSSSLPPGNGVGNAPSATSSQTTPISPCAIVTHSGSTSYFNGLWLKIKVPIPANYGTSTYPNCTASDTAPLDCWWKINYNFSTNGSTDNTVWRAAVEGDPIHLTQ
jgi:Flp pilus assembly protein TadG